MTTVTVTATGLPLDIQLRINDFCAHGKTGQIVLHVKDGLIVQIEENTITKVKPVAC